MKTIDYIKMNITVVCISIVVLMGFIGYSIFFDKGPGTSWFLLGSLSASFSWLLSFCLDLRSEARKKGNDA